MKKIFILAIILLSGTAAASAQEFLTINPDVRTAGMANASVATTGGAYSVSGPKAQPNGEADGRTG